MHGLPPHELILKCVLDLLLLGGPLHFSLVISLTLTHTHTHDDLIHKINENIHKGQYVDTPVRVFFLQVFDVNIQN